MKLELFPFRLLLVAGSAAIIGAAPAHSQLPAAAPTAQQQAAPGRLSAADLEREAALQAKVSLEAKSLPLGELLALLQKQSGVNLRAAAGSPANEVRVTARIKEMPLWNLLAALSRLYGVEWNTSGPKEYTMHGSSREKLSVRMLALGGTPRYDGPQERSEREQQGLALKDDIMKAAGGALGRRGGIAVSSLPGDLQIRLLQYFELPAAEDLAMARLEADGVFERDLHLHFGINKENASVITSVGQTSIRALSPAPHPALSVRTGDGTIVMYILPSFAVPPSRLDLVQQQMDALHEKLQKETDVNEKKKLFQELERLAQVKAEIRHEDNRRIEKEGK